MQSSVLDELCNPLSERDRDAARKAAKRNENSRIYIPDCENPQRRERCLADWQLFLKTYFEDLYDRPFEKIHCVIADALLEVSKHGGKQAVAAPRGFGKSEIVNGMVCYLIFAGLIRFPVLICQTTTEARERYNTFRKKITNFPLLAKDFPEVCVPAIELQSTPQKGGRQHIDNQPTNIVWTMDRLRLPDVPAQYRGPINYGGVRMEYRGLDAGIRGINREGDRPDFVPIDDPETRESAKSDTQIADRTKAIDQDVNGLAGRKKRLAQCIITTIQTRKSLSFQYVHNKPAWMGQRFGWVDKWPEQWTEPTGMWHEYIRLRQQDQDNGDRFGRTATQFYLDNRERMEAGGELMDNYHVPQFLDDGWQAEHSAWQTIFNEIADTSYEAFCTEYQNEPPEESGPQGSGLTAEVVASRQSGLDRRQLPANTVTLTAGIDLGKYDCHWVVTAWWKGAGGVVVDYGVLEVTGTHTAMDNEASEPHIFKALVRWREQMLETQYVDATGVERKLDAVFVDSGTFTNAAYEFVRQVRAPFHVAKGIGNYKPKTKSTATLLAGDNMHASKLDNEDLWLFDLSADYWKNWVHERFLTPTFDEENMLRSGALSMFSVDGSQKHRSYAHHIVAEELVQEFVEGKGTKTYWHQSNKNNHWLDATYLASAAGRYAGDKQGVFLLHGSNAKNVAREINGKRELKPEQKKQKRRRHGPNLNRRAGGWMQSVRNR